ncbi:MAG: hypothetical protein JK586_15440 [Nocardiopsis sp. BM-2018]|nr:MAG: hypothetical protein JK586_15440 [Nocardiopsis sp. BM-2018]
MRGRDGKLVEVVTVWTAEAERFDGDLVVASATGHSADEAWASLRTEIDEQRTRTTRRIRLVGV